MRIFATVVRDLGKELIENLEVLSRNLKLQGPCQDMALGDLFQKYASEIAESLENMGEDSDILSESMGVLIGVLEGCKNDDYKSNSLIISALINKLACDSIKLCQRIVVAIDNIEKELDVMKVVAKSWEFDPPIEDISDIGKFRSTVAELSGIELDSPLAEVTQDLCRSDITSAASIIDSSVGCGDYKFQFEILSDKYLEVFNKMDILNEKVYNEFIKAAETPENSPDIHQAMNRAVGGVSLSVLDEIKTERGRISAQMRARLDNYIGEYLNFRESLARNDEVLVLGRLDTVIKERVDLARFYIQGMDRLDIMLDRSVNVISSNINKLVKIKTSKKEFFEEMFSVIHTQQEQTKKAS